MKQRSLLFGFSIVVACIVLSKSLAHADPLVIGSKKFTESITLGEILQLHLTSNNVPSEHKSELGGSRILWNALLSGDIDLYPEYTSTIEAELLKEKFASLHELERALNSKGLGISEPLGFNNTYAIGMLAKRATELGISKISDLREFPEIKIGWSEEFRRRSDGWIGLKKAYKLPHNFVRGLDHDIAYRALESGDIEVKDLYSTDAEIEHYKIKVLEDDLKFFPRYDAVVLFRLDAANRFPSLKSQINKLAGKIDEATMIRMNHKAKIDLVSPKRLATEFLVSHSLTTIKTNENLDEISSGAESRWKRIAKRTTEHLYLVFISLTFAILVAVPMGILAIKAPRTGTIILWITGTIQTIPSLALLVVLIKPLNLIGLKGIGETPALIALFLYSLLPILRGTHAGLQQIPKTLQETADVLAISARTKLLRIELPLALPSILSGIKTAAVINVGFATLGALIGAGGFGQPILTGIRLDDYSLILEGAVPSAILAILVQGLFDRIEKLTVSPGLK